MVLIPVSPISQSMPIRDKFLSWYFRHIIRPKMEDFSQPGFIVVQFTEEGSTVYLRDVFLPEDFFIRIEDELLKRVGPEKLYSIGKRYGHAYAAKSAFPVYESGNEQQFRDFARTFVNYAGLTWSKRINPEIDLEKRVVRITAENYIVCNQTGNGQFLGAGGTAGVWSYATGRDDVEGVQVSCEGRGDSQCEILCGPETYLDENGLSYATERDLPTPQFSQKYKKLNKQRETTYSTQSFSDFLGSFIERRDNGVFFGDSRHFLTEAGLIDFLEVYLPSEHTGVLFDCAFAAGEELGRSHDDLKFATDYLSASGWGDIHIKSNLDTVQAQFYPWTERTEDTEYTLFRGFVSGLTSGITGKAVEYRDYDENVGSDGVSLVLSR